MKLTDLLPSKDTLGGLQSVEKQLQSRRYTSAWSLLLVVLAGIFQVLNLLLSDSNLSKLPGTLHRAIEMLQRSSRREIFGFFTSLEAVVFYLALIATVVWLITRYTGILFKQTGNPFRYTFSIEDFARVKDTPLTTRFDVANLDRMNLLRNDLTERLKRRVQRFSLRETPPKEGASSGAEGVSASSHFQIKADYAIREDETGDWILHVWPRIRIGAEGNSYTLAYPVRLPILDGSNQAETETLGILDLDEYQRLVERVYSSIATEIYKQIEVDLIDKMTLFPTLSLRALARYVEAEDFETSNTIDAYDRALDMYRTSLEELGASWVHWLKKRFHVRSALRAEAKTKLGYSRCLIYRRLASEMAGRNRNSIYASRKKLQDAVELLRQTYNSFFWVGNPLVRNIAFQSEQKIATAQDAIRRPLRRKLQYRQVRIELCETLAVSALSYSTTDDSGQAEKSLLLAETLATSSCPDRIRLLLYLAKAELEPVLRTKLDYLNQARDLSLDSEIVLYRLAYFSDLLARDQDDIAPARVKNLNHNYEEVLRLNPANIASIIGQGYLLWLVDDLDAAAKKLRAGIELQSIVKQTFVGDLRYCLARVTLAQASSAQPGGLDSAANVRRLYTALFHYEQANIADPSVGALYREAGGKSQNAYYELINQTMLASYERFVRRADLLRKVRDLDSKLIDTLSAQALNDHGNACLSYYYRLRGPIAADPILKQGIELLRRCEQQCPESVSATSNYFWGLSLASPEESREFAAETSQTAGRLLKRPEFLAAPVLLGAVTESIRQIERASRTVWPEGELTKLLELGVEQLKDEIGKLETKLKKADAAPQRSVSDSRAISIGELGSAPKVRNPKTDGSIVAQSPVSASAREPEIAVPRLARPSGVSEYLVSGEATQTLNNPQVQQPAVPSGHKQPSFTTVNVSKNEALPNLQAESDPDNIPALQRKVEELKYAKDKLEELNKLEELVHRFLIKKTRLAPFAANLKDVGLSVLENKHIDWLEFGDVELNALKTLASVWVWRPDVKANKLRSLKLCRFILDTFGPDDFLMNQILFRLSEEDKERALARMRYVVDYALNFDRQSRQYLALSLDCLDGSVSMRVPGWPYPSDEQVRKLDIVTLFSQFDVVEQYKSKEAELGVLPAFHRRLVEAYKLAAHRPTPNPAEVFNLSIVEHRAICKLNPNNEQDRNNLIASLGRRFAGGDTLNDPLEGREPVRLVELEFSSESITDLGFNESGLSEDIQKRISDLRARIEAGPGFTFPGINFRDNRGFGRGTFRLLLRNVPCPLDTFRSETTEEQRWQVLTNYIYRHAVKKAERLYTWQHCQFGLTRIEKELKFAVGEIRGNYDMLFALTWVLKALLNEQTPIGELTTFRTIVAEFLRCRSFSLDLVSTVENVRVLPKIRSLLKGNSLSAPPAVVRALDAAVETRIASTIDWGQSEPMLASKPVELRRQIRSLASAALRDAQNGSAVLLTGAVVRPFVRSMVSDLDISVLSSREIFPELLANQGTRAERP